MVLGKTAKYESTNDLSFRYSKLFRELFDLVESVRRYTSADVYAKLSPVFASFANQFGAPMSIWIMS